jgi:hypothetical protein
VLRDILGFLGSFFTLRKFGFNNKLRHYHPQHVWQSLWRLDSLGFHSFTEKNVLRCGRFFFEEFSQLDWGGLMKETIGAQVMVTLNIHTDLDVANGVRVVVEGIVLDEREQQVDASGTSCIHLQYPPRYIIVKLLWTKAPRLHGLPENVIPIEPVTKSFTIIKNGNKKFNQAASLSRYGAFNAI